MKEKYSALLSDLITAETIEKVNIKTYKSFNSAWLCNP